MHSFLHPGIDAPLQNDYNMHKQKQFKTEVNAMEIKQVLSHLDTLLEQQQMSAAADYLDKMAAEAEEENDVTARLTLYNEIIGFHRVSGNREKLRRRGKGAGAASGDRHGQHHPLRHHAA